MDQRDEASLSCSDADLYTELSFCFSQKEAPQFLSDAAGEPNTEATGVNAEKGGVAETMILENEKKCSEKMKQDPPYNKSGTDTVY